MIYLIGALLLACTLAAAVYRRMQRRPADSGRAMSRDMLAGAAIFAFMGLAVVISIGAQDPELLLFGLYGLPWAYLFGGIPALLCGMTAGALKPAAPSWLAILRMGLIGAAYAFVFLLTFGTRDRSLAALGFPLVMGALPAALAGLACARVLYGKPAAVRQPA